MAIISFDQIWNSKSMDYKNVQTTEFRIKKTLKSYKKKKPSILKIKFVHKFFFFFYLKADRFFYYC